MIIRLENINLRGLGDAFLTSTDDREIFGSNPLKEPFNLILSCVLHMFISISLNFRIKLEIAYHLGFAKCFHKQFPVKKGNIVYLYLLRIGQYLKTIILLSL